MSPPAVVIRLEVEAPPRLIVEALTEGENARLFDWVGANPDYSELVERALDLESRERAA